MLFSSSVVAALAGRGDAASIPDGDVAYLRLLIAAELLGADFQATALASRKLTRHSATVMKKMAADEKAHYTGLARLVTAAGQTPATADDIDFSYPKGSFASEASILKLASEIEALVLGAYLGSIENIQTADLRLPVAQIAANEAQQVSALAPLVRRPAIGSAFAAALPIDAVSAALDRYES